MAVVLAVALAMAIVLNVLLTIPVSDSGAVRPPKPVPKPHPVRPHRGTLVPASGAYLGAYVGPTVFTAEGRIDAFRQFEQELDASLEIVHVYYPWGKIFPTAEDRFFVDHGKILLLSWGGDPNTRAIIAGKDDAMIRARAEAVKALGHPIMMEFRHEMDRPNLQWTIHGAGDYIKAWDHVRAIFTEVGATNVSWVWCPTALGFKDGRAQRFYPGNNEVNWVCADVYSNSPSVALQEAASSFLKWASHHDKPVIIGEFGVGGKPARWPEWIAAAGQVAETDHQIKAMVYFDAAGTDSGGHPYSYLLGSNSPALRAFAEMAQQPFFNPVPPNDP